MSLENRTFTSDEVIGEFNAEIMRWINETNRVPARKVPTRLEIYEYATRVYEDRYSEAMHPFILDKYK